MEEEEIKKNDIFDKNYEEMDISDLENELIELLTKEGIPDISSKLGDEGSKLQKRMYGLGKNRKLRKAKWRLNQSNFWALPYIGVLQSEYIEK